MFVQKLKDKNGIAIATILAVVQLLGSVIMAAVVVTNAQVGRNLLLTALNVLAEFIMPVIIAAGIYLRGILVSAVNTIFFFIQYLVPDMSFFISLFGGSGVLPNVATGEKVPYFYQNIVSVSVTASSSGFLTTVTTSFRAVAAAIAVFLFIYSIYKFINDSQGSESIGKAAARFAGAILLIILSYQIAILSGQVFASLKTTFYGNVNDYLINENDTSAAKSAPLVSGFDDAFTYYSDTSIDITKDEKTQLVNIYHDISNSLADMAENLSKEDSEEQKNGAGEKRKEYDFTYYDKKTGKTEKKTFMLTKESGEALQTATENVFRLYDLVRMSFNLINIIIMVTVMIAMFKLFGTMIERYVIWCVSVLISPFFFACFASQDTKDVTGKYFKSLLLQEFLIMVCLWSTRIAFAAINVVKYNYTSLGGMLTYVIIILAIIEIPKSIERYFKSVGMGAAQILGGVGESVAGAVQRAPGSSKRVVSTGSGLTRSIFGRVTAIAGGAATVGSSVGRESDKSKLKKSGTVFGAASGDRKILDTQDKSKLQKAAAKNYKTGYSERELRGNDGYRMAEASGIFPTDKFMGRLNSKQQSEVKENFAQQKGSPVGTSWYTGDDGNKRFVEFDSRYTNGGSGEVTHTGTGSIQSDTSPIGRTGYIKSGDLARNGAITPSMSQGFGRQNEDGSTTMFSSDQLVSRNNLSRFDSDGNKVTGSSQDVLGFTSSQSEAITSNGKVVGASFSKETVGRDGSITKGSPAASIYSNDAPQLRNNQAGIPLQDAETGATVGRMIDQSPMNERAGMSQMPDVNDAKANMGMLSKLQEGTGFRDATGASLDNARYAGQIGDGGGIRVQATDGENAGKYYDIKTGAQQTNDGWRGNEMKFGSDMYISEVKPAGGPQMNNTSGNTGTTGTTGTAAGSRGQNHTPQGGSSQGSTSQDSVSTEEAMAGLGQGTTLPQGNNFAERLGVNTNTLKTGTAPSPVNTQPQEPSSGTAAFDPGSYRNMPAQPAGNAPEGPASGTGQKTEETSGTAGGEKNG